MAGRRARNGTLVGVEVGGEELAELLGLAPGSVSRLAAESGLPRTARGRYPVAECVRWYAARLKARAIEHPTDLHAERRKLIVAQREGQELANAEARAALLDTALMASAVQHLAGLIATRLDDLLRLAPELARLHDPVAVNRLLFDACREVRRRAAVAVAEFAAALQADV